jgi:PPOX class probable F420-dependent enzyme
MRLSRKAAAFIRAARVAHLATANAEGEPLVVPICFIFDGKHLYTPIDEKPKKTAPANLRRVKNITANPRVSLVVDRYDEDWTKLAYILVMGIARIVSSGEKHRKAVTLLRRKYRQYRSMAIHNRPMIIIRPRRVIVWGRA